MQSYFPAELEEDQPARTESLTSKELLPYAPLEYRDAGVEALRDAWQGFEFLPTRFSSLGFNGFE